MVALGLRGARRKSSQKLDMADLRSNDAVILLRQFFVDVFDRLVL